MKKTDVLLIEDDCCLARALVRQLRTHGVAVVHRTTVASACELEGHFRIGVFDIDLPDGDGIVLARSLLARQVVAKAVFNTGCTDPRRLTGAREIGAVFGKCSGSTWMAQMAREGSEQGTASTAAAAPP